MTSLGYLQIFVISTFSVTDWLKSNKNKNCRLIWSNPELAKKAW